MQKSVEQQKFELMLNRMEEICEDNGLSFDIYCEAYPFVVEISSCCQQISMPGVPVNKIHVRYEFSGSEMITFAEKLQISSELQRRLENMVRKIHRAYLELFWREHAAFNGEEKKDEERKICDCHHAGEEPDAAM